MVDNGFVYAVNKGSNKRRKQRENESSNYDKLVELLKKYNVDFSFTFSIANWTKADLKLFKKVSPYTLDYATQMDNKHAYDVLNGK